MSIESEIMDVAFSALARSAERFGVYNSESMALEIRAAGALIDGSDKGFEAAFQNENPYVEAAAITIGIVCAAAATPIIAETAATYATLWGVSALTSSLINIGITGIAELGFSKLGEWATVNTYNNISGLINSSVSDGASIASGHSQSPNALVPDDQSSWGSVAAPPSASDIFNNNGNIIGSQTESYNASTNASIIDNFSGPNGTGTITSSQVVTFDSTTGQTTYKTYTGPDGSGRLTQVDVDNPDGTSTVTTYNPQGSSVSTSYSGPDGTGTPGNATANLTDGTDYVTVAIGPTSIDFAPQRTSYSYSYAAGKFEQNYQYPSNSPVYVSLLAGEDQGYDPSASIKFLGASQSEFDAISYIQPVEVDQNNPQTEFAIRENPSVSGNYSSLIVPLQVNTEFPVNGAWTPFSMNLNIRVSGKVYNQALAQVVTGFVNFGSMHVGDPAYTRPIVVENVASGALTDSLAGSISFFNYRDSVGGLTSTPVSGIAAGRSGRFMVSFTPAQAGVIDSNADFSFISHDPDQADGGAPTNDPSISVTGTIYNYASAAFEKTSGAGILTQNGYASALDLGTITVGAKGSTASFQIENTATGPADTLAGSFSQTGAGFINKGFAAFSGVAAQNESRLSSVTLSSSAAGTFSETITLSPVDKGHGGYTGALAAETLTITGTVVAANAPKIQAGSGMTFVGASGVAERLDSGRGLHERDDLAGWHVAQPGIGYGDILSAGDFLREDVLSPVAVGSKGLAGRGFDAASVMFNHAETMLDLIRHHVAS